jgi:hypothetical protein
MTLSFPEKNIPDEEQNRTSSYKKVSGWIFQNTDVLQKQKKETDQKSVSSVSVREPNFFTNLF